ncbi:MAG: hypothetical protein JSR34_03060 [Proteobacteria bacterium]|nr:hypothetical protein [Pseudomonadota bacterium]
MSTQIQATPVNRERSGAREVLLAGIGAVSLIRKNATGAVKEAVAIVGRVPAATSIVIEGLGETGSRYRDELIARATGMRQRATTTAGNLAADIQSRLEPMLGRFNDVTVGLGITVLKPKAKRQPAHRARKAVKTVAKRKTRKAA